MPLGKYYSSSAQQRRWKFRHPSPSGTAAFGAGHYAETVGALASNMISVFMVVKATPKSILRRNQKEKRADVSFDAFFPRILRSKSGFGLLRASAFLALRFQLRELLSRKNCFGLFEECLPALVRATGFHAFGPPRFDLYLLIGREIKRRQVDARH
jgi:hypothetical protein